MVYTGKPSGGCENCRKAKKRCDQGQPSCARCLRLGKTCGGYRDTNELLFRDQSADVARRASAAEASSSGRPQMPAQSPTVDREQRARALFREHFVSSTHLSFLEGASVDDFLQNAIMACAYAGLANRDGDVTAKQLASRSYIDAIAATNTALRNPDRMKEDRTLISVLLLGLFERITWESQISVSSWKHHVQGATEVIQLRGRSQFNTKTGAQLFRECRYQIIMNALASEGEVPEFIVQWTQILAFDPIQTPIDQLAVLAARTCTLRKLFRGAGTPDQRLYNIACDLDTDLAAWFDSSKAPGSPFRVVAVEDRDSSRAWMGMRHEYAIPQAHRYWNTWRCLRIITSRVTETVWRHSWPVLTRPPNQAVYDDEHHKQLRSQMATDVCISAAYAFGASIEAAPPAQSVGLGYMLTLPLCLAGTVCLEGLSESLVTPDGARLMICDEPQHMKRDNESSAQLAWIIQMLRYIGGKVGVKWADVTAAFLEGKYQAYYDLGRSSVLGPDAEEIVLF